MKNLAGDKDCDKDIRRELERAKIDIVEHSELPKSEVPYRLSGRIGRYELDRAWYYWRVKGLVPLRIAKELYDDPVGKTDIRCTGHCGCPSPEEVAQYYTDDGKKIVSLKEKEQIDGLIARHPDMTFDLSEYHFSDTPELDGDQYINGYHIDSELGLRIFADIIRKNGALRV